MILQYPVAESEQRALAMLQQPAYANRIVVIDREASCHHRTATTAGGPNHLGAHYRRRMTTPIHHDHRGCYDRDSWTR